jgi:Zn-dependent protease
VIGSLDVIAAAAVAVAFVVGIPAHHWAHARMAIALGDKSAKLTGRATLRLKPHVDTLGTIIMPIVFVVVYLFRSPLGMVFGWGKPQSVNIRAFRKPRRDAILVALAGPAATLAIAIVAGFLYRAMRGSQSVASNPARFFGLIGLVCLFLTVIELLPIPGRDGGRILVRFLSPHAAMRFEEFVQYDVIFLIVLFLIFEAVVIRMVDSLSRSVLGS